MKNIAVWSVLLFTGCAGPKTIGLVEVAPPTAAKPADAPTAAPGTTTDEVATRRWLDEQVGDRRAAVPAPGAESPVTARTQTTDEEATRAWLDRTIEDRRTANPDQPPVPIQAPVDTGSDQVRWQSVGYDASGQPVYLPYAERYETPFPVNTAVGAGIGALIGHSEGAAIGAGVGFLFDLTRWIW